MTFVAYVLLAVAADLVAAQLMSDWKAYAFAVCVGVAAGILSSERDR